MPEKRNKYDREFSDGAVRIVEETKKSIAQVCHLSLKWRVFVLISTPSESVPWDRKRLLDSAARARETLLGSEPLDSEPQGPLHGRGPSRHQLEAPVLHIHWSRQLSQCLAMFASTNSGSGVGPMNSASTRPFATWRSPRLAMESQMIPVLAASVFGSVAV